MADRKPLKVLPDGGGDSAGLAEFVAADTIGVVDGGTGLAAVGANQLLTGHDSSTTGALTAESNLTFDGSVLKIGTSIAATADTDTTIGFPGSDLLTLNPGGVEAVRMGDFAANGGGESATTGRVVMGSTVQVDVEAQPSRLQVLGGNTADGAVTVGMFSNDAEGPKLKFLKSRNTTIGSNTIIQNGDQLGSIQFHAADGGDFVSRGASIQAVVNGTIDGANDVPTDLRFGTCADGAAGDTERMRIDSTGKTTIFHTGNDGLIVDGSAQSSGVITNLTIKDGDANPVILTSQQVSSLAVMGFTVGGSERMQVNSRGNVNIGGAANITGGDGAFRAKMHQDGNLIATFENSITSGNPLGVDIDFSGVAPNSNSSAWFMRCQDSSAVRGYWYSDGTVTTAAGNSLASDERLKTNIVDASDKLADVMKLHVRNFEWTPEYHPNKAGEKKIGFIAQELETVFPSLIMDFDIARGNGILEELYGPEHDTQYYTANDDIPDGKQVGDVKTESQIPEGKKIGDVKVAAKAHEPTMRKAVKDAFAPILVKALQEVTVRLEAAEAKIAALESA